MISKSRIQELDALRLFAAISVVVYHLTYRTEFPQLEWLTGYGYLGVELFFMISGFVIPWSIQGRTPWQFGVSRFARLYPLFWLSIAITALVVPVTLPQILANMTMVSGYLGQEYIDGVYWTLQVELKFYLLVGVLLLFKQESRLETWLAVWLTATIAAEFIPNLKSLVIYPYSPLFIGGALCFLIRSKGIAAPRLIMLAISLVLAILHAGPSAKGFVDNPGFIPEVATALIFTLLLLTATNKLPLRCPIWASAMTYPLYLTHNEIGRRLLSILGGGWLGLTCTLGVIAGLAFALSLLDKPLGNYAKLALEKLRNTSILFISRLSTEVRPPR